MVNYKKAMEAYIEKEIVVLKKLDLDELNLAMEAITDAFHRDAKIYTMESIFIIMADISFIHLIKWFGTMSINLLNSIIM